MKIFENGVLRELTDAEATEYERQNKPANEKQDLSYEDMVNLKIRERYTESQEFAILRQRDEKPEEFAEYYTYCEECKKLAKESLQGSE